MARPTFSLRTMLVVIAAFGVVFAEFFAVPEWLATLLGSFLNLALPAILAVGIVFGRNYCRAFCIGAIVPAICTCLASFEKTLPIWTSLKDFRSVGLHIWLEYYAEGAVEQKTLLGIAMSYGTMIGLTCIAVRWLFARGSSDD